MNGKYVQEKMLNITNHQENANQNQNEIPFHTHQDGVIKTKKTNKPEKSVGKDVKKLEPLYTVGNVGAAAVENSMSIPKTKPKNKN